MNKSLNIRDVGVMFDETDKDPPDFMVRIWTPADSLFDFMSRYFPWLDYEYLEVIEALGGEAEVHSLRVWLNDLGKQYLAVESYFANGAHERDEPHTPDWGQTEYDPDWEAFSDDEKEEMKKLSPGP